MKKISSIKMKYNLLLTIEEKDLDHVMILLSAMKLDIHAPYHNDVINSCNDQYFEEWLRKKIESKDPMLKYLHVSSIDRYLKYFVLCAIDADDQELLQILKDGISAMIGGDRYVENL